MSDEYLSTNPSDSDENTYSLLVYNLRSGKIILTYHVYVAAGAIPLSESEISSKALELASSFTETSRDSLGTLQYDGDVTALKPSHRVNVQEKSLVEIDSEEISAARQISSIVPP
jgi:hypothetical protein